MTTDKSSSAFTAINRTTYSRMYVALSVSSLLLIDLRGIKGGLRPVQGAVLYRRTTAGDENSRTPERQLQHVSTTPIYDWKMANRWTWYEKKTTKNILLTLGRGVIATLRERERERNVCWKQPVGWTDTYIHRCLHVELMRVCSQLMPEIDPWSTLDHKSLTGPSLHRNAWDSIFLGYFLGIHVYNSAVATNVCHTPSRQATYYI
jgi:hypothetical protein